MSEKTTTTKFLIEASKKGARMFRVNTAQGWAGKSMRFNQVTPLVAEPGDVIVRKARPLHAGLCDGGSDCIGWNTITITPEMVGEKIAVFTAVEMKSEGRGPTEEQANFINQLKKDGGRATVAWSVEQAMTVLD